MKIIKFTLVVSDDTAQDLQSRADRSGATLETLIQQSTYMGGAAVNPTSVTIEESETAQ